jgi:dipeptidyl aminopeptidase/acylaminoacyl peptidase
MHRPLLFSLLLAFAVHCAAQDSPALASATHFFQDPTTLGASISPNGRFVALRVTSDAGRTSLVIVDVTTMRPSSLASYTDADVASASWLNDERMMFTLNNIGREGCACGPGSFAIDRIGGKPRPISATLVRHQSFAENAYYDFESSASAKGLLRSGIGADEFLVAGIDEGQLAMMRFDSRTGATKVLRGPFNTRTTSGRDARFTELEGRDRAAEWLVDENGQLRVAGVIKGNEHYLYVADRPLAWRKFATFDQHGYAGIEPLLFLNQKLYVRARNGGDKLAIYRYDLANSALEAEPLISAPGFDVGGNFIVADKKILGFHSFTDTETTVWFDAPMKAAQAEADRMLPGTINQIARGTRSETPNVLIYAHSDSVPPAYYLMNTETRKLTRLGAAYPNSNPGYAASRTQVHYKARDGMDIHAALTLPKIAVQKQLPMVVLAKTWPWLHNGDWDWEPVVQFLAARGYAVLQPEPRGTDGFGAQYAKAGRKQLGRAIQDEIADGVRWASAQGVADPARVCIAGTKYGGYAAVMGLIRNPELFQCAVSWSGIVDPALSLSYQWKAVERWQGQLDMSELFGDESGDVALMKSISTLNTPITRPLLLAHGEDDTDVPLADAEKLKAANPAIEWVTYAQKDRQLPLAANRIAFWTRVDAFLAKHIGTGRAAGR